MDRRNETGSGSLLSLVASGLAPITGELLFGIEAEIEKAGSLLTQGPVLGEISSGRRRLPAHLPQPQ
jgi:hypothetical protein